MRRVSAIVLVTALLIAGAAPATALVGNETAPERVATATSSNGSDGAANASVSASA